MKCGAGSRSCLILYIQTKSARCRWSSLSEAQSLIARFYWADRFSGRASSDPLALPLFVDLFHRDKQGSAQMVEFANALFQECVDCPTANHGFGWDAMTLCAVALTKGDGAPSDAIAYLESGVPLEGVTGQFRFSRENHNGREGPGPTRISRWQNGRLEGVSRV